MIKTTILTTLCIDENKSENANYTALGSPGIFIESILGYYTDTESTIISHYGHDLETKRLKSDIHPQQPRFQFSLRYINDSRGKSRIQYAKNRDSSPPVEIDDVIEEILQNTDIFFFAPLIPNYSLEGIKKYTDNLRDDSLKIVLPQGYLRRFDDRNKVLKRDFEEESILGLFDFAVFSDEDQEDMIFKASMYSTKYAMNIIVTQGANGATIVTEDEQVSIKTKMVDDIIDSVGSGDIFSAAFGYKLYKSEDILTSIEEANRIAGICLKHTPDDIHSQKLNL